MLILRVPTACFGDACSMGVCKNQGEEGCSEEICTKADQITLKMFCKYTANMT